MTRRSTQTSYDESNIQRLKGLEAVRRKPGMYLGERGNAMVFQCVKEIFDNSADEYFAGRNKAIYVYVDNKTNTYLVADKAHGIPVGLVPVDPEKPRGPKASTLTLIFTELHTGGKFNDKAYAKSRGCFVGSQKVSLLNGKDVSLESLYRKYSKDKKPFYVYSFDVEGETAFVPRLCTQVHKTMLTRVLCDVTLDTGKTIRCTPDHPFLTFEGAYIEAQNLEKGQRLRALYLSYSNDGYELHSGRNPWKKTKKGNSSNRTQRTVLEALGVDVEGAQVHHKNGKKWDNRPTNLEPIFDRSEHFWEDYNKNGKHRIFVNKNKRLRAVSSKNLKKLNQDLENPVNAQVGKIIQCAARALRDYGKLTDKTYEACRGWCYPSVRVIPTYFTKREVKRLAKQYLSKYGPKGRTDNGGQGLNYKLQSEYENSPVCNTANHFVKKVRLVELEEAVPVYDLTVEGEHNYLLSEGVFVHNTHGVGAAGVNAVSTSFEVWTCREKKWYYQKFACGKAVTELKAAKPPKAVTDLMPYNPTCGSIVLFSVDQSIVSVDKGRTKAKLDVPFTATWMKHFAQLNPGLEITFSANGKTKTYLNKKDVGSLIKSRVTEQGLDTVGRMFVLQTDDISVALQWSSYSEDDGLETYVCSGRTRYDGEHEVGFRNALTAALAPFKRKTQKFAPKDAYSGLIGILDYKMHGAEYNGQTKDRLTSAVSKQVEAIVYPALKTFFAKNKTLARAIIKRAIDVKNSKEAFKKTLTAIANAKKKSKSSLPAALVAAPKCKIADRELYLVEGDSAAGTGKSARDSRYQELMKLNGKIMNVAKQKLHKVLESEKIQNILSAIGYNFDVHKEGGKTDDPYSKVRVGKVILLPDADEDGHHIRVLILTLLWRLMPGLFDAGLVYVVDAPLFNAFYKNKRYFGNNFDEVKKQLPAGAKGQIISRAKGWGEISPEMLEFVAFKPATRTLIKVSPPKGKEIPYFEKLVGNETEARKELLGV